MSDERAEALEQISKPMAYKLSLYPDARGWLMVGPAVELYGPISYVYATTYGSHVRMAEDILSSLEETDRDPGSV